MNKNRQSVIRDDTQLFNAHSGKEKGKTKIYSINNDEVKEEMKEEDIKEESVNEGSVNKKIRKPLMKEIPGYPNDLSSQRTDKNLLLKQNKSKKSSEKGSSNIEDLISEKDFDKKGKKKRIIDKNDINMLETSGMKIEEKVRKKDREDSISSWDEDLGEDQLSEDKRKEINKKWYKAYYLTNLAMKLNHGDIAVRNCDEMITLCDEPLNSDQIKITLAANSLYINQLRKSQRSLVKLLMEEKEAKNLIYEIKVNKEKAIIERCEKFIKLINEYILPKMNSPNSTKEYHDALFLKTKADYYRYLAEVTHGHELFINKQNALHFYMEAKRLTKNLDNLNAIKLDIALNYSVFLNEIMNKRINSYFAAKEAVFNALSDLKNCTEQELAAEEMRDSLICIEILNRNVEEWYNEEMEADNEEAERKKRELIDKANEKNLIDAGEGEKKEEDEDEENKIDDEEEVSNGGLEDIIEDGEKEKEENPLIKEEDAKEE